MRSPREIGYRLRQEWNNLKLLAVGSRYKKPRSQEKAVLALPDAERVADALRTTSYAAAVHGLAQEILAGRIPIFRGTVTVGRDIAWRRDYASGIETGTAYFRRIPYLDATRAGDHKQIWELNRQQHLVLLAQEYRLTGSAVCLEELQRQIESWLDQNPYLRGMNWASALEAAFRAWSWLWILHLVQRDLPEGIRSRMIDSLHQHGMYLENNLSYYFSPNTHLLGEAVALHALGRAFPNWPEAGRWAETGHRVVLTEMERQVQEDGSHFEQSSYYHVYAVDMFLAHAVIAGADEHYRKRLLEMGNFLDALLAYDRRLPFLGDDDGGRFFHPYGDRSRFGAGTLAALNRFFGYRYWDTAPEADCEIGCWWMGEAAPSGEWSTVHRGAHYFSSSGLVVLFDGNVRLVMDCGPFGPGSGGHSHADALSLLLSAGERDILVDSGTFSYTGDKAARDRFRGTRAHNTVCVDGMDQAVAANPFRWSDPPEVSVREWAYDGTRLRIEAECRYRGITHRRLTHWLPPGVVLVVDAIYGAEAEPPEEHHAEQRWHLGSDAFRSLFRFPAAATAATGEWSRCYGQKEEITVLTQEKRGQTPLLLCAAICLDDTADVAIAEDEDQRAATFFVRQNGQEETIRIECAPH